MQRDDIDFLLSDELKNDEKPDYKLNCDIKRAMREKDSKRGVSLWWIPLFGALLSFICVSLLPIVITTNSIFINELIVRVIESTKAASIFVITLTVVGVMKFDFREEARL
ncbi:MAG: hypothetical protein ACRCTZ_02460 [Sarcina sp.]